MYKCTKGAKAKLRAAYAKDHYPSDGTYDELVRRTGLAKSQITKWFCNERARCGHAVGRRLGRRFAVGRCLDEASSAADVASEDGEAKGKSFTSSLRESPAAAGQVSGGRRSGERPFVAML